LLAALFALIVLGSLTSSALLHLEIIPASPAVLVAILGVHGCFAWAFFRSYAIYRSVHRFILEGQGELFDLAMSARITRTRTSGFRVHLMLRHAQGLALAGRPTQALVAVTALLARSDIREGERVAALAARAEANLQLGTHDWARRALTEADTYGSAPANSEIQAIRARLAFLEGTPREAIHLLAPLTRLRAFPLTRLIQCRNGIWLADAMGAIGDVAEAQTTRARARGIAPRSHYAAAIIPG